MVFYFFPFLFYVFRADSEKADDSIEKVKEALFIVSEKILKL